MSDDIKPGYDPANQSPAEGQSHAIPEQDRGKAPNFDPADKDGPAEGARDAVPGEGAELSGAAENSEAGGRK